MADLEAADDHSAAAAPADAEAPEAVTAQLDALSDMQDAQAGYPSESLDVPTEPAAPSASLPVVTGEIAVTVEAVLDPLTAPLEALTAHGVPLADLPTLE